MRQRNARFLAAHCASVLAIAALCLCAAPASASERDATSSETPEGLLELKLITATVE